MFCSAQATMLKNSGTQFNLIHIRNCTKRANTNLKSLRHSALVVTVTDWLVTSAIIQLNLIMNWKRS
jgi:hypothetical protein